MFMHGFLGIMDVNYCSLDGPEDHFMERNSKKTCNCPDRRAEAVLQGQKNAGSGQET